MSNITTTTNSSNTSDIPFLATPFLHYIPTSPPSQELDFHLPSRTPLHGLTVSEWAGTKTRHSNSIHLDHISTNTPSTPTSINNHTTSTTTSSLSSVNITHNSTTTKPIVLKDSTEDNWKDVYRNIKCMDQLYDASFYSWLKSEENVLVTAMYLHRIANEYPLVRIINALKWLISDWRLESISTLVRHVTVDWCDEAGDLRRAHLLRHLTHSWATQYTTTLITMVLSSAPYTTTSSFQRERFLRAFTKEWDFSKLSEFFMYLQSPANIDYKVKCVMLQEAARRERETLGAKLRKKKRVNQNEFAMEIVSTEKDVVNKHSETLLAATEAAATPLQTTEEAASSSSGRRHHRRTSSNDVNDIKRLRLSTPDLDHTTSTSTTNNEDTSATATAAAAAAAASASSTNNNIPLLCVTNSTGGSSMSSELSHLHLGAASSSSSSNGESSTNQEQTADDSMDVFISTCYHSHLRRRSSSSASNDSDMMIIDETDINKKRTNNSTTCSLYG